ncbi:MAG: DUF4279 domain-containing protein [Pseudomonadota bacterium]
MDYTVATNRDYAYFHAIGSDDANEVSDLLKIVPDATWNVGDTFTVQGRTHHRRSSSWRLDSGLSDEIELSQHVQALLQKLERKRLELNCVQEKFLTEIVCVSFCVQSFGWRLNIETQRRATSLGISFSFDFYPIGDVHQEIVNLREQLLANSSDR